MSDIFNVYMIGVGGQGIGILSEVLMRTSDKAGFNSIGVDTHGLAQRGGTVESHLRIGNNVHSPLIKKNEADLVVALERHEALRGLLTYLKNEGTLIYYDAVWQPLSVRMEETIQVSSELIKEASLEKKASIFPVYLEDLESSKMQNIAVLAEIAKRKTIPGIGIDHYVSALKDVLSDTLIEKNLRLFLKIVEN